MIYQYVNKGLAAQPHTDLFDLAVYPHSYDFERYLPVCFKQSVHDSVLQTGAAWDLHLYNSNALYIIPIEYCSELL